MKNSKSFHLVLTRKNLLRPFLHALVLAFSSWPALVIEIFTRRKFGERYFSLGSCFTALGIVLFLTVWYTDWQVWLWRGMGYAVQYSDVRGWNASKIVMLVFAAVALIISFRHKREIKRQGQTLDMERFSQSGGIGCNYWYRLYETLPAWLADRYPMHEVNLQRYYEPVAAIIAGLICTLLPFTRILGLVLIICGVFYYWRSAVSYAQGRHLILDMIDDLILTRETETVFVDDAPPEEHSGVFVMAPRPKDRDMRQALYDAMEKERGVKPDAPSPSSNGSGTQNGASSQPASKSSS